MEKRAREQSDRELVQSVLRDEPGAFERLVEKYHSRIFRLVLGIIGDWQLSEDVCQDVFVIVYTKLSAFGFRSKLSTWIHRVTVNAALKARARYKRRREERTLDGIEPDSAEDRAPIDLEDDELVSKVLRPLPSHLRAVVILKEREGLSYREIAEILECSPGAVEQRLYRAFSRLREIWKDRLRELGLEG